MRLGRESRERQIQNLTQMVQRLAVNRQPDQLELVGRQQREDVDVKDDFDLPPREPQQRAFPKGMHGGYYHPRKQEWEPIAPRWDMGFKLEIPEFYGSLALEEFLDWMSLVDEMFTLKEVPADKKVSLVAIRFKDRVAAWWQSYRYQRYLDGLPVLEDWGELKREIRKEFLPYNYQQTLFQNLQSLMQGSRSVEEYTLEFYRMVARNQLRETQEQLVVRYLYGLRPTIQDALQVHNFGTITDVQTKAKVVEKSLA